MCEVCAKRVLQILEKMEKEGEFDGLTEEEKQVEKQMLGMRLRAEMKCPMKKG